MFSKGKTISCKMSTTKNIYTILDIPPDTPYDNLDEIKKSYREKARKYHPDVNPDENAEDVFKELTEAYEIASDPNKRRQYDMETGFNPNTPKHSPQDMFGDFAHFMSGFTGNPFFTRGQTRSIITIQQPLPINYMQLFNGDTIKQTIKIHDQIVEKEILLKPKELRKYDEPIKVDGSDILIRFIPEIVDDRSLISSDANEIMIDRSLNINLIYNIGFEQVLTGGTFKTTIFNEPQSFKVPKCCEMGHSFDVDNLNLLINSKTRVSFVYDLPKLSDKKIYDILQILNSPDS